MQSRACSNCGTINRSEARFCLKCGKSINQGNGDVNAQVSLIDFIDTLRRDVKSTFNELYNSLLGKAREPEHEPGDAKTIKISAPTKFLSELVEPKSRGGAIGGYIIQEIWALQHSNYYKVRPERCPQGHANQIPIASRCGICQAEFNFYLVHETQMISHKADERKRRHLIELSQGDTPGFLSHLSIFDENGRRYVVCEYPGNGWRSLPQMALPISGGERVKAWSLDLGKALSVLASQGLVPEISALTEYLEPIIVTGSGEIKIADLAVFNKVDVHPDEASGRTKETTQLKALRYMAQILYIISSGNRQNLRRAPHDFSDVPPMFRALIRGVVSNDLVDLGAFLIALEETSRLPESRRGLRQIAGYRTDIGRKRNHNEDFVGKYSLGMQQTPDAAEVGLYLVADGMGGHKAGEVASRDVVRVILEEVQEGVQVLHSTPKLKRGTIKLDMDETPGAVLTRAVQQANEVLYNARKKVGSDKGTTLTAALIVGDTCAIANVGDSRTYLWRNERLDQITHDHSLVASLVAARMIQPDEARNHPQRSQIYRNLGDREHVEVDVFECSLLPGDRFLLCSDGLWEMVLEKEIQQVVGQAANPQEVCDRLVDLANLAGGEDNISTVAVWIA